MADSEWWTLSEEVGEALRARRGVVALESTVIAQGLPRPRNLETALQLEATVRESGAVPATIAVIEGRVRVGLDSSGIERIATGESVAKLSTRDLPVAIARGETGATTVAATAHVAHAAGIHVFATGGIGGVHRGDRSDVSADLAQLQSTTVIVVCSGAKSLLDLPATREALETLGVLVLGWRTERLPAFYTAASELTVDARVESAKDVEAIYRAHRCTGGRSAILLTVPVPPKQAIPAENLEEVIERATSSAARDRVRGKELTPYLMSKIVEETGGEALEANVALLRNNASVAAEVAVEVAGG